MYPAAGIPADATNPCLVRIHFVIEDQRVEEARGGVDAIEHRYHKGRVVHLQPFVQADDLADCSDAQEYESDDARSMCELDKYK